MLKNLKIPENKKKKYRKCQKIPYYTKNYYKFQESQKMPKNTRKY